MNLDAGWPTHAHPVLSDGTEDSRECLRCHLEAGYREGLLDGQNPMDPTCPALLNIRGKNYSCEAIGSHDVHGNIAAGAIWSRDNARSRQFFPTTARGG